ncbi:MULTISPECIES: serine hydrolase domain-containing protein [Bacillaceae]|uniref:Penicillin-binding protein n=2 Tax=Bacillaceae TaxID=186817 RepID=A0A9D5DST2_9BACI|nr:MULTISPECIES: serine hydrolase [Bacillaceae]KQL56427.1 penicillin-binding protein [Alkalicoccobacillus plakortidis]MBG9782664.1 penicillin-binding protein [Shouchella lehensis]RQW21877.1 class C beta-lactamase-related serine hydrolase [Bacillus sp. C1-1]TES47719.1 class C beta-lactamase-related serine hydrolase [Shouchella lehensis]
MNKYMNWTSLTEKQKELQFSGSIHVRKNGTNLISDGFGHAIRSEQIKNQPQTRFSIASGSKIFTSIAICKLVEEGKLTFDTTIKNCLRVALPYFDDAITIHHLLTHTSGIPDYFDEDKMDDYEELWETFPMYQVRSPKDFLPMFQLEKMQDKVGRTFKYNNTGYILLGLVVEAISGMDFDAYIAKTIFTKIGMTNSGYFSVDELPENVACGYIEKPDGAVKTNVFSLPAKGGPDGGAYVTAHDMGIFWEALMNGELLSAEMMRNFMAPQEPVDEDIFYGYIGYMESNEQGVVKFIQMGYDPGVNYRSVYYPEHDLIIIVCSNQSEGAYEMLKELERITVNEI